MNMSSSSYQTIEFERVDADGWLRLNRPDRADVQPPPAWRDIML